MKKNNHHHSTDKDLKVGDIVHVHHSWDQSVEVVIKEWQGAWKTFCIIGKNGWEGKTFTLAKDSDNVFRSTHSKLLRILYGYRP